MRAGLKSSEAGSKCSEGRA